MIQYGGAVNKTPGEQMDLAIVKLWMASKDSLLSLVFNLSTIDM